jgi:mannose-6-phosphate isomerase-like protein (cupin superfamily)
VQFVADSGEPVPVSPGRVLVIPRYNWHEVRNVGTVDCQVLHFYSGVGSVDDIGYEAYDKKGDSACT